MFSHSLSRPGLRDQNYRYSGGSVDCAGIAAALDITEAKAPFTDLADTSPDLGGSAGAEAAQAVILAMTSSKGISNASAYLGVLSHSLRISILLKSNCSLAQLL